MKKWPIKTVLKNEKNAKLKKQEKTPRKNERQRKRWLLKMLDAKK